MSIFELILAEGGRGTREVALLHRTVTYYDDFIEHLLVFLKGNLVNRLVGGNLYFLGHITNVSDNQGLAWVDIKLEVSVKVGSYSVRRSLYYYTGSDNGARSIDYSTCNLLRCLLNLLRSTSGMSGC